jgi:hypothetical protein
MPRPIEGQRQQPQRGHHAPAGQATPGIRLDVPDDAVALQIGGAPHPGHPITADLDRVGHIQHVGGRRAAHPMHPQFGNPVQSHLRPRHVVHAQQLRVGLDRNLSPIRTR